MYIYLDIVEGFSCEMCGTCCSRDWLITVDENSYYRNKRFFIAKEKSEEFDSAFIPLADKGTLGEYAYIAKQANGSCWFLQEDNRCLLHKKAGHEHLDTVCQTFPRYPMNTSRGIEITLSFSCPAVLKRIMRPEPLKIVRSEKPPIIVKPESCVVAVYPKQQPSYEPLYYYFELEHHFIDILQQRGLSIHQRLQLLQDTCKAILALNRYEEWGQHLNAIIYKNYEYMDTITENGKPSTECTSDIMVEHFFVNLLFKKVLYIYGLERTMNFLQNVWQCISKAKAGMTDKNEEINITSAVIMDIELKFGHNRLALFSQ